MQIFYGNEMDKFKFIKDLIDKGKIDKAIEELTIYISMNNPEKDTAYYIMGNAYRKQGNWQQALNNYQTAVDLNPQSPAAHARNMVMDILNFYNKDMYNQ